MVEAINQSIDVVVPFMGSVHEDADEQEEEEGEDKKIIDISGYGSNTRPLYLIRRKKYLGPIRQQLKAKNRLLLCTLNTYAYYSCEIVEMQQKVLEHMTSTGAYLLTMELENTDHDHIDTHLNAIDERITSTLNQLLDDQSITRSQWRKMRVDRSRSRIDCLYFLPDTRQENVPFHPIVKCRYGLTGNLSHFLSRLLQPIYDRIAMSTTFKTSADAIDAVEKHHQKGLLRPDTLFVTLHVHNLSTLVRHTQLVEALQRFLRESIIDGRVQGIPNESILVLVRLFLENQYLLYDNKLYQQIRGSYCSSPLTLILVNIYMFYWQHDLVATLDRKNEIFGRYFGEIFFTWNESKDQLHAMLQTINARQYSELPMTITMNDTINYLDLKLSQTEGDLRIQVAHDLNTEPYALPYVFGHSKRYSKTWPRAAFIRAVRCCASVFDFANELEDMQLSFEHNRFDKDFFINEFHQFLKEFDSIKLKNLLHGEAYYNQSLYDYLREVAYNEHQTQKRLKIKRCQRQTIQYRWKYPLVYDTHFPVRSPPRMVLKEP